MRSAARDRWVTVLVLAAAVSSSCATETDEPLPATPASPAPTVDVIAQLATARVNAGLTPTPRGPTPAGTNQAQVGDLLLTVNAARRWTDPLVPAVAGSYYVALDVTARNTGSRTAPLDPGNFALEDSGSVLVPIAPTTGPQPRLGHTEVAPRAQIRGFVVFKLADGRTPGQLQYRTLADGLGTIPVSLR